MIVFAVFHLEIVLETFLKEVVDNAPRRSRRDGRSLVPIVLGCVVVLLVCSVAVARRLVHVTQRRVVLLITALLVEELFELRVIKLVVLAESHVSSVVPGYIMRVSYTMSTLK